MGSTNTSSSNPPPVGIHCSSANNHLDPATKKFLSDCPETMFCPIAINNAATTILCIPRLCRRDEFPFGYSRSAGEVTPAVLPPLCPRGAFCPDDGSGCRVLLSAGNACELGRDEQCASAPPVGLTSASTRNVNGSECLCLRSVCMYANVTLEARCITDTTTYVDIWADGEHCGKRFRSV